MRERRRADREIDGLTVGGSTQVGRWEGGPFWLPPSSYLIYGDGGGEALYFLSC